MGTLQAGSRIGCYELIRPLGEGGMGEVWQAHDEPADRLVALKFIKPHLLNNPKMRTRFTNEAKTLGKLDHDRIVPLYAVVEHDEHLAFVLRFIEGQSLAERIATQFPLPASFVLSSARDVLLALGEAHRRGIIHRDIKPQNILVDRQDRSFLTDFGIAVSDSLERATIGAFAIGTPHYMSPEQIARPRDITIANGGHRTDIYSYGVVLFEMLTGRVPFGQDSGVEETYAIQQAHCQNPPPSLREIQASVSPAMEAVVLHCLEKDPDRRPQTCADLLAEIEAASRPAATRKTVAANMSATVLEPHLPSAPTGSGESAAKHTPTAMIPVQPTKNSVLHQPQALAAIGLILAATIGFAVWSQIGKSGKDANPTILTPPPSPAANSPAAQPSPRTKPTVTHSQTADPLPKPKTVQPANPAPAPPTSPNAQETRAAALAVQAEEQFKAGDYCEALSTLDDAIALHPDPIYSRRRPSYVNGCNLH